MFPSLKQYRNWSKPSKYTFWSLLVGIASLALTMLQLGNSSLTEQTGVRDSVQQPIVAIKTPRVGEKVSGARRQSIDTEALLDELELAIRATRKLRMVTRVTSALDSVREEQAFAESDLALSNAAPSGKFLNAHYIILPLIRSFEIRRPDNPSGIGPHTATLAVSAQLLNTASGKIETNFYLSSEFPLQGDLPSTTEFTQLSRGVAEELASKFIETVFPMKVVQRYEDQPVIVINRGNDGGLRVGEMLDAFATGDELKDPDTGTSLGSSETFAGKVRITRIHPKVAYGLIVSERRPHERRIDVGSILRKAQPANE